ncbi:MAG: MFS transporter [Candidatus Methanomethyliaceae archaeon]|nr:MFS transporter [Candidatus Methanomethyliaceae archaeon]MDW7970762.1 MFS transporter [Nitrososphaerota archaeon]
MGNTIQVKFTDLLDNAVWSKEHWKLFATISLNYLLNGVMFSIAPLLAYIIAPHMAIEILAMNLLAEWLGAITFGKIADIYGRRPIFMLLLLMEVLALVALYFTYHNPILFLLFTSIMTFGIGGEFGAAYSALAELCPRAHRGKALMLSTNFWNIGAAIIAGLALIFTFIYLDPITQVRLLLLAALGTAIVVGIARIALPESIRWLVIKGKIERAESIIKKFLPKTSTISFELPPKPKITFGEAISKYPFRLIILAIVTVVQYVTYGMLAYYLPYAPGFVFGIGEAPRIIFIANLGASIGAFILLPLIDRARRLSVFLAFLGGFITVVLILGAHSMASLILFYSILFINLIFSEWAWGSISVLQSELFPTGVRASIVGMLVSLTGIAGALTVYFEKYFTAYGFIIWAIILWLLGLIAASLWYIRGIESARKSLEELT